MNDQYAKHEIDYISEYQNRGYTDNFRIDDKHLISSENKNKYEPSEVFIDGEHRFEGMSNPSDLSTLYALRTKDNTKGTLLAAYGPNARIEVYEFLVSIPKNNIANDSAELPKIHNDQK